MSAEVKAAARSAGLADNQSALLKIAAASKEDQVAAVAKIAEAKAAPKPYTPPPAWRMSADALVRTYSADEVDLIAAYLSKRGAEAKRQAPPAIAA